MKKVERSEILDLGAYEQVRPRFRARVIEEKRGRRLAVSDEISAVFENHDTALLQIQEMLRTERITKESAIRHEIETYNELVPADAELSATMFVEIADNVVRDRRLVEMAGLEACIALEVLGTKVVGRNETRGVLPDRTTAVHYVKFPLGAELASKLAARARVEPEGAMFFIVDHPRLAARKELPRAMVESLVEDLS
ncbi:MAG TPA: DUF3501 family protein [Polyangiaceae bacterium]|nr:DUF3501 family protein [Polyangiaceae bacterium]